VNVLEKALKMLERHPLCNHCLGRQFAFLGHGMENEERGRILKNVLVMEAQALVRFKKEEGVRILKILATNGFSKQAEEALRKIRSSISKKAFPKTCFICENFFETVDDLAKKAIEKLNEYEYNSFLVGIELPVRVEEREDEVRARFNVEYGESIKLEFGRLLSAKLALYRGVKKVVFRKPEIVVATNTENI